MANKPRPPWLVPGYPPLKGDDLVGKAAVEGQLVYYPKVVRSQIDEPINNQTIGCVSLMLFNEPKKMRNGKPVYGFFKLRGNWANHEQMLHESSKIIRTVDSKYKIRAAPVGHWLPIVEEDALCKELIDVKTNKEQITLRNQAAIEKREEQKNLMREIREREEELKSGDIYDDPKSLTYYSMRRVTEMKLVEARDKLKVQLETMKGTLQKVRIELKKLELEHAEYKDQWIDRYNEERKKGGLPDFIPAEDLFDEYEGETLESLGTPEENDEGPSRDSN